MSGIAGVLRLDGGPAARADVERMLARLAHRGPDGAGVWSEGAVGLGHRLLHATPESLRERLPLASADRSLVLTADARIDNRTDLCSVLRAPCSVTDAELILAAYEHWGEHCAEHLLGDFAFAIWDARHATLFCARDHFGVKPFYYHQAPGRLFCFASEIKGLLALAEVPRRLNETRVADYLMPLLEDKVITFYEDIVRLPPAHWMTVTREGLRIEQYWALDPEREIRMKSDAEYAEAFREIFTEAVRCRLRSAFPVGSMLSGGLDSSSIVCVARRLMAENGNSALHTFSVVFPDLPECDERPYIDAVLAGGGVQAHFVRGDRLDPVTDLPVLLAQQDEAFYAPNLFLHWAVYGSAHASNVRVILDGIDGDLTVSHGIGYLYELARHGRFLTLASEVLGLSRRFDRPPARILRDHVIRPAIPKSLRRAWRALRGRRRADWDAELLHPEFARRIDFAKRATTLLVRRPDPARTAREAHHYGLTFGLIPLTLEVADRAAAAQGLEPRYPYFDRRLAEFCLAMPADQKLHGGWTRVVVRRAMAQILPTEVQWRGGKGDLSGNFLHGLLAARSTVNRVVSEGAGPLSGYVDGKALHTAYERCMHSKSRADGLTVWKAVTLGAWLRQREATHRARPLTVPTFEDHIHDRPPEAVPN